MTTSDRPGRIQASNSTHPREAFVWVWLPTATEPVVAGRLDVNGEITLFTYGRSQNALTMRAPIRGGNASFWRDTLASCIQAATPVTSAC